MATTDLVLATVNASHRRQLSARELADYLRDGSAARSAPGHMSAFFGEVAPALQADFAKAFDLDRQALVAAARAFSAYSGESYPLAQ
jgi:hypothetical protein